MRIATISITGGLVVGLASLSCVEVPSGDECERACSLASRCGLLPSALGGSIGSGRFANEDDCVARCEASNAGDKAVQGLLGVLASGDNDVMEDLPLCSPEGIGGCEELVEILEETPETSELEVTTSLQVSMVSAISHASNFAPERWCCFSFDSELLGDGDGDEGKPDMVDPDLDRTEVAAVYEIITSTFQCFEDLDGVFLEYTDAINAPPEDPPPAEVITEACSMLAERWFPAEAMMLMPQDEPDLGADPCYFARMSTVIEQTGADQIKASCSADALRQLEMDLRRIRLEWHLGKDDPDDLLVVGGQVKDAVTMRHDLELEIRSEITRPGGFVVEVCEELDQELGPGEGDACSLIDLTAVDPDACDFGPPCSEADCLLDSPGCDRTLCDADISPPGRDCGFFGIETVTLGYRTDEGVEVLGDPLDGCVSRSEVSTIFPEVKVGTITPIAIVSGTLPTSFLPPDAASSGDGTFEWFVEGDPRWISAGDARVQIPSPLLEHNIYRYENPLEYLGWVLPRVPQGRGCDDQPLLCETLGNDNCDDGIDNDGDGFTDGASPWCDELFFELVERCVVTEPGRPPYMGCRDEQ